MHVAVAHLIEAHTTGNYFRKVLGHSHTVTYLSNHLDLVSKTYSGLPIQNILPKDGVDLLLYIDPVGQFFPTGLEKLVYPTAIYLIDVHQNLEQRLAIAPFFDYVFVAQKDYVPAFKKAGINNVFWLPLACDPDYHISAKTSENYLYDIGFVGNRGLIGSERRELLEILKNNFKINSLDRRYLPDEIGTIYSQSRLVFNYSIKGDVNMRVFEALCGGRLLLTNAIPNGLEELFIDRQHLVIYRNGEELIQLARYYLEHPEEREEIAKAGQALVLAQHTYQHRTEQILTTIFGAGSPQLVAPARTWSATKRWKAYSQVLANMRQPLATLRVANQAWRQGEASWELVALGIKAGFRAINMRIPLTPHALRHRWQVWRSTYLAAP
jgi:hypothetical protein